MGGAVSAAEALGRGDMGAALMFAAGSVVSMSRGTSVCGKGMFVANLQRGMHVVQGIADLEQADALFASGDIIGGLLGLASAGVNAWRFGQACFAGHMKIMARGAWGCGWRRIDQITTDDEVLSRDESKRNGPLVWKKVEEVFERFAPIDHLHAGGQVIATTGEHPFHEYTRGWTAVNTLESGDQLATMAGDWASVEEVYETGEFAKVYNLRVADFHTYFVGDVAWGFGVWAHNAYKLTDEQKDAYAGPART